MNSGATFERVYDALKGRILANEFRPGERLDPSRLGDELHSSPTPIRDALYLLTGEGLVDTRLGDGFHVAMIDAPSLQDLYAWNADVLLLTIRAWPGDTTHTPPMESADATAAFFAEVARRSNNAEHPRAILSVNDRLHAVRLCEPSVFSDIKEELGAMLTAFEHDDRAALRRLITVFHRRRCRQAHDVIRALYRHH